MADALISYPFTEDGLRDALVALGTTPENVARNLLAMGFKGVREEECECPVARYLLAVIKGIDQVGVDRVDATVYEPWDKNDERPRRTVPLPWPVAGFITDFDTAGLYTELEASDA